MKIINTIKIYSSIVLIILSFEGLIAQSTLNNTELSFSNSYDSKYVSEGRCNLASGGLLSFNTDIAFHWFNVNMWYGTGLDTDYRELQFSAGMAFDLSDIGINFGLANLSFLHDDSKDQEFYTELSYNKFNWFTPTLVNVYSFEAEGSFLEFLLEFNIPVKNERLGIIPFLLEGFDLGFVEDTICLNNFQIGFELSFQLIDNVSINGYVASSFGLWEESSHENHTWGGISISTDF
jgi:hypothetical protein